MAKNSRFRPTDPPALLAILIAARRTGNRILEDVARHELETSHNIKIRFARKKRDVVPSGSIASLQLTAIAVEDSAGDSTPHCPPESQVPS